MNYEFLKFDNDLQEIANKLPTTQFNKSNNLIRFDSLKVIPKATSTLTYGRLHVAV